MTCTEVCAIIDACGRNAVNQLKYKGLHIDFSPVAKEVTMPYPKLLDSVKFPLDIPSELNDNKTIIPFELREEELDELMINDPDAWERTVNGGSANV